MLCHITFPPDTQLIITSTRREFGFFPVLPEASRYQLFEGADTIKLVFEYTVASLAVCVAGQERMRVTLTDNRCLRDREEANTYDIELLVQPSLPSTWIPWPEIVTLEATMDHEAATRAGQGQDSGWHVLLPLAASLVTLKVTTLVHASRLFFQVLRNHCTCPRLSTLEVTWSATSPANGGSDYHTIHSGEPGWADSDVLDALESLQVRAQAGVTLQSVKFRMDERCPSMFSLDADVVRSSVPALVGDGHLECTCEYVRIIATATGSSQYTR
ncbi:hypothetical protein BV20DRAFT_244210 [Pilatotrama ljubarskyi]|nr:hypothetical protein BV20DRAFT_244210 [Pilatotrama ljubarskyi]